MSAPGKPEASRDAAQAEQNVVDFLRSNPAFLDQHPDLLVELSIPHASGEAVSLLERQLNVLREENARLKQHYERVIKTARQNETLNGNIHALVLALIDAAGPQAIFERLDQRLRKDFGADHVAARIFAEPAYIDDAGSPRFVGRDADLRGPFEPVLAGAAAVCGVLGDTQRSLLFGGPGAPMSAVTMPLAGKDWDGVLVIASNDAQRYQANMGTDFLTYLKDVVVLVIDPWVKRKAGA